MEELFASIQDGSDATCIEETLLHLRLMGFADCVTNPDSDRLTLLSKCVLLGKTRTVQMVLDAAIWGNERLDAALRLATVKGYLDIVKLLIQHGADPKRKGGIHLVKFVYFGQRKRPVGTIRFKVPKRVIPDVLRKPRHPAFRFIAYDAHCVTCLTFAAASDQKDLLKFYLQQSDKISDNGWDQLLLTSSICGAFHCCKYLLSSRIFDSEILSKSAKAAIKSNLKVLTLLLENGAVLDTETAEENNYLPDFLSALTVHFQQLKEVDFCLITTTFQRLLDLVNPSFFALMTTSNVAIFVNYTAEIFSHLEIEDVSDVAIFHSVNDVLQKIFQLFLKSGVCWNALQVNSDTPLLDHLICNLHEAHSYLEVRSFQNGVIHRSATAAALHCLVSFIDQFTMATNNPSNGNTALLRRLLSKYYPPTSENVDVYKDEFMRALNILSRNVAMGTDPRSCPLVDLVMASLRQCAIEDEDELFYQSLVWFLLDFGFVSPDAITHLFSLIENWLMLHVLSINRKFRVILNAIAPLIRWGALCGDDVSDASQSLVFCLVWCCLKEQRNAKELEIIEDFQLLLGAIVLDFPSEKYELLYRSLCYKEAELTASGYAINLNQTHVDPVFIRPRRLTSLSVLTIRRMLGGDICNRVKLLDTASAIRKLICCV